MVFKTYMFYMITFIIRQWTNFTGSLRILSSYLSLHHSVFVCLFLEHSEWNGYLLIQWMKFSFDKTIWSQGLLTSFLPHLMIFISEWSVLNCQALDNLCKNRTYYSNRIDISISALESVASVRCYFAILLNTTLSKNKADCQTCLHRIE